MREKTDMHTEKAGAAARKGANMEKKMDVADTRARRKPQLAAKRAMDVLISGAASLRAIRYSATRTLCSPGTRC